MSKWWSSFGGVQAVRISVIHQRFQVFQWHLRLRKQCFWLVARKSIESSKVWIQSGGAANLNSLQFEAESSLEGGFCRISNGSIVVIRKTHHCFFRIIVCHCSMAIFEPSREYQLFPYSLAVIERAGAGVKQLEVFRNNKVSNRSRSTVWFSSALARQDAYILRVDAFAPYAVHAVLLSFFAAFRGHLIHSNSLWSKLIPLAMKTFWMLLKVSSKL